MRLCNKVMIEGQIVRVTYICATWLCGRWEVVKTWRNEGRVGREGKSVKLNALNLYLRIYPGCMCYYRNIHVCSSVKCTHAQRYCAHRPFKSVHDMINFLLMVNLIFNLVGMDEVKGRISRFFPEPPVFIGQVSVTWSMEWHRRYQFSWLMDASVKHRAYVLGSTFDQSLSPESAASCRKLRSYTAQLGH